jgi:Arc/MetJ-type ribon-helix-helix transcriptional regulator
MKRTTVMLPDDMAARLRYEAGRRGVSTAELVREAVERYLPPAKPGRKLAFFAIGEGRSSDDSERVDEIVLEAIERKRGR